MQLLIICVHNQIAIQLCDSNELLDNTLEFSSRPNENVLGYRGKITYVPSASHLVLADWIQLFPIVSYQYASASLSETAQNAGLKETHGITFQILAPIVFSEKFFMQITPIYQMNNLKDERQDGYVQELFASYSITKTMQITGYYNGNFTDKIHTLSLGLTVFLVN